MAHELSATPKELTQQDIDNLFAGLYKDFTRIVMYAMCDLKYLKKHSAVAVPATDKHDKDRAMLPQELITKIIGIVKQKYPNVTDDDIKLAIHQACSDVKKFKEKKNKDEKDKEKDEKKKKDKEQKK